MLARVRDGGAAALVCAGVIACIGGFLLHAMWGILPWHRLRDALLLALLSMALAGVARRAFNWAWADGVAVAWAAALVFFAGPAPILAALLIASTALALGGVLVGRVVPARGVLALAVGLVLLGAFTGWLLPLPIHRGYVYWPVLLGICAWRAGDLRREMQAAWAGWQTAVAAAPRLAAFAVMMLGLASVGTWLPTMQADDLAYHLALPSQLGLHGVYALDPSQQIWALAPWLGDVLQGIAQVLAGGEARGAVDALWLVLAACALWELGKVLGAAAPARWLMLALFASQPLLLGLLAGMQTELPATALLLALALAVVNARAGGMVFVCAVLAAGLCALKLGHAVAALVMLAWAAVRVRRSLDWRWLPLAVLLFLAVAGSSFFYAWQISGNPLLPLFNDVFRAEVMAPRQLDDPRWRAGFGLDLPWSITFATDRYLEAWPGGFGFTLVALAGAWLLALARRETRGIALVASAVMLLPLLPMQYARYAFPGLVLLLAPLVMATVSALGRRTGTRLVVALCALNLAFQTNTNGLAHSSALRRLVTSGGDAGEVYRRYAPERALIAALRARDPGDSIVLALDAQAPNIAELAGRGRSVAWYAPALERAGRTADGDASGERWRQLFDDVHARWLLLPPAHLSAAQSAGLARSKAQRVLAVGDAELWSIGAEAHSDPGQTP